MNRILTVESPPSITGPTMLMASDYSGTDKKSGYHVTTILCTDMEASWRWEMLRREVRRNYLSDGRRMSYKALNDQNRAKALIPFLSAAEYLHGLCLVIVINKSIRHLCINNAANYQKMRDVAKLRARWKDRELETMLRLTHFVAVIQAGLSQPGQNIYWISDEDSVFANMDRSSDVAGMLSSYTSHYIKHSLGELGVGTTSLDEGDRVEEDLSAVADLVAGAIAEVMTRMAEQCGGRIPRDLAVERHNSFLPKADLIARWLWLGRSDLRRVTVLFEKHPDGFTCSRYQMLEDNTNPRTLEETPQGIVIAH
jgi:hypothetical protein